jgi:transposase-like protein
VSEEDKDVAHEHDTAASLITHPLQHCPRCGSDRLEPVVEARVQEVHFLCQECGRCWDVGLGAVRRVPPATCFGCPARGRCVETYALDHPEIPDAAT